MESNSKKNTQKKKMKKHTSSSDIQNLNLPNKEVIDKYARGNIEKLSTKGTHKGYKHLRRTLGELKEKITSAAKKTAATEILNPDTDGGGFIETEENEQKTFKLKQNVLKQHVDVNTQKNILNLELTKFGPYRCDYSRNGRFLCFGGQKGHISILDCLKMQVGMELHLQETVNDVQYLHNESLFAAAQRKYTYIYDNRGVEIHCMKNHERPYRLDYLPYHYLLTSIGHSGWIKWQDVSIGEAVAGFSTGHGPSWVLKHNRFNGVSHVGHTNGVVSLWSPASGKALVSMFCHKASITDIAIDRSGTYMATAGNDSIMKIWDLRKYGCVHAYKTDHPVNSLDYSDKGLLAMGIGRTVQIMKDPHLQPHNTNGGVVASTYMRYEVPPPRDPAFMSSGGINASTKNLASSISIKSIKFRPLEDVLCIGSTHGVHTIVVPGAGEANYDSFEANPFINTKQRREQEVQGLLNKLHYDTIGLDSSFVGKLDTNQVELRKEHQEIFEEANRKKVESDKKNKHRARGRNKISAKLKRKQKNVIDAGSLKLKEALVRQKEERERIMKYNRKLGFDDNSGGQKKTKPEDNFDPLTRFLKK